jgi:hypothetical protein
MPAAGTAGAGAAGEGGAEAAAAGSGGVLGASGRANDCGSSESSTTPVDGDVLYVKASNPDPMDAFGTGVALTNDWLAVGAPNEDSRATGLDGEQCDDSEDNSGAVYLFAHSSAGWTQAHYIKASNTLAGDGFGNALSLDADTLAVGAPFEDGAGRGVGADQKDDKAGNAGAVYVFRQSGGEWAQEAYVKASNTDAIDLFGTSIALLGTRLVVGAPWEDSAATGVDGDQSDNSADRSGAAYVFERGDGGWIQTSYLKASDTAPLAEFGTSVAQSSDLIAVGAPGTGAAGEAADDHGAVYVFESAGGTFEQTAVLRPESLRAGDRFGAPVAVDGDLVAVSATGDESAGANDAGSSDTVPNAGAVYVFARAQGVWSESAVLKAPNAEPKAYFGCALALGGGRLFVGAFGEDRAHPSSGAVYVYTGSGSGFALSDRLTAPDGETGDRFGSALGLSPNGLAAGAMNEAGDSPGIEGDRTNNGAPGAGAAFLYRIVP